ncbi:hypothetical protein FH063_002562 [Azospirillum argentinense]|uniref:Uncharacterized protein n=1 Tax=Azospirillum argentinense TaxID=2970906 RepID=A0A5B0KS44_9PROT|nr:hypothetical protein FH063_002562 [Azospirillum argentinense]
MRLPGRFTAAYHDNDTHLHANATRLVRPPAPRRTGPEACAP